MKNRISKRIMAIALSSFLVLGLTACGAGNAAPPEENEEVSKEDEGGEVKEEKEEEKEEAAPVSDKENMLDNGDFESGTDPWQTFCQDGECAISVNGDGELDVDIKDIGTVEHGVQLYHDGFSFDEGCVYRITFDCYSDIERPIQLRFQINGGDYHAYYMEYIDIGTSKDHYDYTFTMNETSDPAPRFCFNMGLVEDMDKNTAEHHVYFDNFALTMEDDSGKVAGSGEVDTCDILVDQLGFLPSGKKYATIRGNALNNTVSLINEDTKESVLDEEIGGGEEDPDAGDETAIFDFTSVKDEGTYHIEAGDEVSPSFKISKDVYGDVMNAALKLFYYQRCGTELTKEYAGDFAHKVCHTDKAVLYEDRSKSLDVSGGWHDAGDYGRYPVAGAKAAADLLLAYEDYPDAFNDEVGIPESGNGTPDVLDEARYELEWLFKMQTDEGGVYHKVTCQNFPGEVLPEEETDELIIMPVSTTATGDFAGVMAIAARVYADVDKEFADKCLDAAKKAAEYLDKTPRDTKGYKNPSDISTGEYEDVQDTDERFWAYAELFKTTGDAAYEEKIKEQIEDWDYALGWQAVAGYGAYAYLSTKGGDASTKSEIKDAVKRKRAEIIGNSVKSGYGSSIIGDYVWGSNLTILNNGNFLIMTNAFSDTDGKEAAVRQLHYIFGNNPTGYSYVTGFGTLASANPHHRPSQVVGKAVPGMVVGGPNNGLNDPYVQNVLKDTPSAKCYADNSQSYSTNEIAIYWNSPLIYLLAALGK